MYESSNFNEEERCLKIERMLEAKNRLGLNSALRYTTQNEMNKTVSIINSTHSLTHL
jgi:hypothetical protein